MGHEQHRIDETGLTEAPVVEASDNRLARSRGHHHEVAPAPVDLPFGLQFLQDLLLVAERTNLKGRKLERQLRWPAAFDGQRLIQPVALSGVVRIVWLEGGVFPVFIEGGAEGVQQMTLFLGSQADVPLQPIEQRRPRQVRRADIGRREPCPAMEYPRLGMQAGRVGLVGDFHLRTHCHQPVQRLAFGRPDVGGGEHSQPAASANQALQMAVQHPYSGPAHERTEQVHVVRRCQLPLHLGADPGLAASVDEQGAGGEGDFRPWWEPDRCRGRTERG